MMLKYLYPVPNTGPANSLVNNYVANFPTPITSNQGDARVDQILTSNQSIFARITYKEKLGESAPSSSQTPLAGSVLQPEHDWALTVAHNWVITPSIVNEIRGGWTGSHTGSSTSAPAALIASELGLQTAGPLPPGDATPQIQNFRIHNCSEHRILHLADIHSSGSRQPHSYEGKTHL